MKISELIEFLTEQKEQYGDIEVWHHENQRKFERLRDIENRVKEIVKRRT